MIISFGIKTIQFNLLLQLLSQKTYDLSINTIYSKDSALLVYYDVGNGYNDDNMVHSSVRKGVNRFDFELKLKDGEQLKGIRLDFGWDNKLKEVEIQEILLTSNRKILFDLGQQEINKEIFFFYQVAIDKDPVLHLEVSEKPFDPHIVLNPINDLIYPKWLDILLLVLPWFVLFFLPTMKWLKQIVIDKEYALFLTTLFIVSIPLKSAWVSFTAFLLLAYAMYVLYKRKTVRFNESLIAIMMLFIVPLIFIHRGELSDVSMALGFVIFPLIASIIDFSNNLDRIKQSYSSVFLVVMSITLVSWISLIVFKGYYYDITAFSYFKEIKLHAHTMMYWLYNGHTTFLSFFILIGVVFCQELYTKDKVSRNYALVYGLFSFLTIIVLGSRFALVTLLTLPFLYKLSVKNLIRWMFPLVGILMAFIIYFIGTIDLIREQLWKMSWVAFKDRILFGHGTGSSKDILQDLSLAQEAGFDTILDYNHSHNQYLTYLLETGILGVSLVLFAVFFIIREFVQEGNKVMVLICFLLLLLMSIESPFETATPLYVIGFLLSAFSSKKKLD